jgi:hypothetical protein
MTLAGRSHDYKRNGTSTLFAAFEVATGKVTAAQEAPATRRISRFHERHRRPLSGHGHPCRPRQPQYPQAQERPLAQASPERAFPLHADTSLLAPSGRDLVFDSGTKVPALLHLCGTAHEHIDAFIEAYNEDAKPFVWTKAKVHQRRVKGRRISELLY